MPKLLMAGGGTLGSVSPLVAVASHMKECDVLFVGTRKGPERSFVTKQGIRFRSIITCKWRRYLSVNNFIDILKFPFALIQACVIVLRYRPDIILTSGGFVSVPIGIVGSIVRIPVVMHQQDIEIGFANKILRYVSSVVTVTFQDQVSSFSGKRVEVTGNPCRFSLSPVADEPMVLILGGSLGARTLNAMMNKIIPRLCERYHVVHSLGAHNFDQRLSIATNYTPVKFLSNEYEAYVSKARVVVSRAGLSTLTELGAMKKAVIVIPIPESHQEVNAHRFHDRGAVLKVDQNDIEQLYAHIEHLMEDDHERSRLQETLHSLFPSGATERYVSLLRSLMVSGRSKSAHLIGIGGIGISALVPLLEESGYTISGSDLIPSEITRRLEERGIPVHYGHQRSNLPRTTELVIYSSSVPAFNEELVEARARSLRTISYNEYLGELSRRFRTIAISGTHGKTTTTAMLGRSLSGTKLDPTVIVGALIPQFNGSNFRKGTSEYLVLEACEYRSHMLLLAPHMIIVTNVEADHLDYFKDLDDIKQQFARYVSQLPEDGVFIKNADDPNSAHLFGPRTITFGFQKADYVAGDVHIERNRQSFSVTYNGSSLGTFALQIPGLFNVANATATIAAAHVLGIQLDYVREQLATFVGSWRRFEYLGLYRGRRVISDYAHHPTELRSTIAACRSFFPDETITVVFQPHSYNRTEKLYAEFLDAFLDADYCFITDIYDVPGRDTNHDMTGKKLFEGVNHPHKWYLETLDHILEDVTSQVPERGTILVCGAGSIDSIVRSIVKAHAD